MPKSEKPFSWLGGRGADPSRIAPDGWTEVPIPQGCGCDEFEYCEQHVPKET